MADLTDVARFVTREHGLVVVSTSRADGSIQSSVVNAGVLAHPVSGEQVVGYVAVGGSRKLANLRERPRTTLVLRVGWEWITVEGTAQLIGPDDPVGGVDAERLRLLLREVFTAAGGTHEDFDEYDRVMAAERRTAVLVTPSRIYSNG
ncbi:TIGR03618 family F420-dependent PPOX class oxidoreductase [Cryptosporangium japonicum]|uniref:TIGR03618 family F420-dependent PPOX class oxidoreductase n=1 Tax=Cryptosporangium japonicum TaxID=80872 RepID=A0ABN0TR54_9ACTN